MNYSNLAEMRDKDLDIPELDQELVEHRSQVAEDREQWEEYFLTHGNVVSLWSALGKLGYAEVKEGLGNLVEGKIRGLDSRVYRYTDMRKLIEDYPQDVRNEREFWIAHVGKMAIRCKQTIAVGGDVSSVEDIHDELIAMLKRT